jgi:hypothetical protein
VLKEFKVLLGLRVLLEHKVLLVLRVLLEHKVIKEFRGHKGLLELRVQ